MHVVCLAARSFTDTLLYLYIHPHAHAFVTPAAAVIPYRHVAVAVAVAVEWFVTKKTIRIFQFSSLVTHTHALTHTIHYHLYSIFPITLSI